MILKNFLFIIALYVRDNDYAKQHFRNDARELFRKRIIPIIENEYDFFVLKKKNSNERLQEIVNRNFRIINGKVYRPFSEENPDDAILVLALEKSNVYDGENKIVKDCLANDFDIYEEYNLNKDVKEFIKTQTIKSLKIINRLLIINYKVIPWK